MKAVPATETIESLLSESEWVGALALSLVGDPNAADDLAQETWLAALRRPPEDSGSPRPWLATVARNAARFKFRSERARRCRESLEAREKAELTAPAPDELIARLEVQELVLRLVRELPPELSEVIMHTFFEGKSSEEVAHIQGVAAGTVRWRKKQGLELLRERLTARHGGNRNAWMSALAPLAQNWSRRHPESISGAASGVAATSGFLAPLIAMSLTAKSLIVVALALLAALPFLRSDEGSSIRTLEEPNSGVSVGVASIQETTSTRLAETPTPSEGKRSVVRSGDSAPDDKDAAPVTRLRLRVVNEQGHGLPEVEVTPSPSIEVASQIEDLLSDLSPQEIEAIQAGMLRTSDRDGVVRWETNLLRETGEITFHATSPNLEAGELRLSIEPGSDRDLGDLILHAIGKVRGTALTIEGQAPARLLLELGPAQLPENAQGLAKLKQWGPDDGHDTIRVQGDGSFEFQQVTPGEYRVYTVPIPGQSCTWSEVFEVRAGQATEQIELIAATSLESRADILVLGADGKPLSGVSVAVEKDGTSLGGSTNTKGLWDWTIQFERIRGGRATITDDSLVYQKMIIDPLPESMERVTVSLVRAPTLPKTLHITDPEGNPLSDVLVRVETTNGSRTWNRIEDSVELPLPASSEGAFDLLVSAPGYRHKRLESLAAGSLPEDWSVSLKPLPGIQGLVLSDGEPVARARIEMRLRLPEGEYFSKGDDLSFLGSIVVAKARTKRDGRFLLHMDADDNFALLISARGFADALVEIPHYDHSKGVQDLVVELSAGGTLQGFVRNHDGSPAPQVNVLINHPLHQLRSTLTAKDGSYSFTRIPPGDWFLHTVPKLKSTFFGSTGETEADWKFPANCTIVDGAVRNQDIVLVDPLGSSIAGQVRFRGMDPGTVQAALSVAGASLVGGKPFVEDWEESVNLDTDGRFDVALQAGRDYVFAIKATRLGGSFYATVPQAVLPAYLETEFSLSQLSIRIPEALQESAPRISLSLSWTEGNWTFGQWLAPGSQEQFEALIVPAGELSLTWSIPGREGSTSISLDLESGSERVFEIY